MGGIGVRDAGFVGMGVCVAAAVGGGSVFVGTGTDVAVEAGLLFFSRVAVAGIKYFNGLRGVGVFDGV